MSFLPDELYKQITDSVPLPCIDLIPIKKVGGHWSIGIITRGTGIESGKPSILGGRIYHNESITNAITRNMQKDWGITKFKFHEPFDANRPFYVQQYFQKPSSEDSIGYDPTKHAVSLTYIIELEDEPIPKDEARDFYWITESETPTQSAYNHNIVMKLAFDYLKTSGK